MSFEYPVDNESARFLELSPTEQALWRTTYKQWDERGFPDETSRREAWLRVWSKRVRERHDASA